VSATTQELLADALSKLNAISTAAPQLESAIPQPDANGDFATPLDGALWMAMTWGIAQVPITPRKKFPPCFEDWPEKASTDPAQIRGWWIEFGGCNFASVALGKHAILEIDVPDPRPRDYVGVSERFRAQGGEFTSKLLVMSSTKERGHRYYIATPDLAAITQAQTRYHDFSVRVENMYALSPGSIHPSGARYRVVMNSTVAWPSAPAQMSEPEIAFLVSEKVSKAKAAVAADDSEPIPAGARNSTLASLGGRARPTVLRQSKDAAVAAQTHGVRNFSRAQEGCGAITNLVFAATATTRTASTTH
jgi:hypothetical protein